MKHELEKLLVEKNISLREALRKMDEIGRKLLIIVDHNKFYSLLSIGDIQRAIIKNNDLNLEVQYVLRQKIKVAYETDNLEIIKNEMRLRRNEFMPVLSVKGIIKDIIFWEDLFKEETRILHKTIDLPVIIMAGGEGTRMQPLTNVLPKPLIPLNDKTIIEEIIDEFAKYGATEFFISLNYKADFIQDYLVKHTNIPFKLHFFREEKPLGTAGSLHLLKNQIRSAFFVTNCDILIDQDLEEVYDYHTNNENALTIFAALKNYSIPYGTLEVSKNGILTGLNEKPDLNIFINSGIYLLESNILEHIPDNQHFNITELISDLLRKNMKIGVYPVSEKSWIDIGNWNDYLIHQQLK